MPWPSAFALFVLAAVIRFWGIGWGAPLRFDFHPDETIHVMNHALAVSLSDPDPKFLNYPSFLIYLIAITNGIGTHFGWVTEVWQSHVLARGIVALFGAATAPAVVWLAVEISGSSPAGLLCGLWVALMPLHVWESHFAVTDVIMTFWIVVVLAFASRFVRTGGGAAGYLTAGAAIGLGIASKYTAALVGIAPLVASLVGPRPKFRLTNFVLLGMAALAAAFVGTPYSFLHPNEFREAMAFEYRHVHSQHYGFSLPAPGWQYHKYVYELFAAFPFDLGIALYVSAAAGAVWAVFRRPRELWPSLAFAAVFFAILGKWTFIPLRYQLPVTVIAAMLAGLWQADWLESGGGARRMIAAVAVLVTLAYTAVFTTQTTARFQDDTRSAAGRWLDQTLKPGQRLLTCGYHPYLALPSRDDVIVISKPEAWISHLQELHDYDLVEITSLHFWRHERHRHRAFLPAYQRFRGGETGFRLVKRFEADFLNRDFYRRLDPMFAGYFVSPTIEFYERVDAG